MGAGMLPNRTVIALLAGLAATAWSIVGAALPASTRLTNGFASCSDLNPSPFSVEAAISGIRSRQIYPGQTSLG